MRFVPATGDEAVRVLAHLVEAVLDLVEVLASGDRQREAHLRGVLGELGPVLVADSEEPADHACRVGLGELGDELALSLVDEGVDQLVGKLLELRHEPIDVAGGEGRVDELAQAHVLGAFLVEHDVGPPASPVADDAVVFGPARAALDQALVVDEPVDLLVAQDREAVRRARVRAGLTRGLHRFGADREGEVVDVEERQVGGVDGGFSGGHTENSTQ